MIFLHPERALGLAIALALVAALAVASWLYARRRAARLLGSARFAPRASLARDLVLVAALAATAAALLGPQWGVRSVRVPSSGVDVVLLLDVSRSMEATDVPPSRLARARAIARALLERLEPEDRAALAVFADYGVVLAPLTPDAGALAELIAAVDGDLVEPRGSDLGDGVRAAVSAFETASERPRVVVAIGDGEDADARDTGAATARRAGARVVTVALGTETGAALGEGDARGRPIVTRRDAERLAALASDTDGAALRADRWGDVDLTALVAAVRRDAGTKTADVVTRRVPALQALPLAALALALLALEAAGALRMPVKHRARQLAGGVAALALVSLGAAHAAGDAIAWLEARLRENPGDARLLVALGVARAEAGQLDEAAHALRAAALGTARAEDAASAYYDLGLVEIARERWEAAQAAFLDALALAPDDAEARFNLEWAARAAAAHPPAAPQRRASEGGDPEGERPDPEPQHAAAPPDLESDSRRDTDAERSAPRAQAGQRFAPELSPDRVAKWLAAVGDEPARGLRDAARNSDARRAARATTRW